MINNIIWKLTKGNGPIVVTLIHYGHDTRDEKKHNIAMNKKVHLHEEAPFTSLWTEIGTTQIKCSCRGKLRQVEITQAHVDLAENI